ncbi:MAG: isoprenylcysteine carboxylmethyltransferase family protein [Acidobacteriota bacterium]|nr:isoprenylcysteine carboxylmethyltransferase family protein [Acidobacteriota bacterium]
MPILVFILVMCSWFAFVAVFFFRKKPEKAPERKRDRDSVLGVAIQGVAYALVWSIHRTFFSPLLPVGRTAEVAIEIITVAIAFFSVWIVMSAVRTLGKEWSVTARLVEGHELATRGPYRFMRHPIYTGMLGMLLATGLAISQWFSLLAAIVVFFIGTIIRVRSEERLLREQFGAQFDDYARRVAAMLPGVY